MSKEIIAKASEIIKSKSTEGKNIGAGTALTLIDSDGYPTAATISPCMIDGIRSVTFCTGMGSNWVKRIEKCDRASVCFNSEEKQYNITLVGTIEIVTDIEIKKEAWFDGMGYYFKGPDDPGFCVLRFTTKRYSLMLNEHDSNSNARGTL